MSLEAVNRLIMVTIGSNLNKVAFILIPVSRWKVLVTSVTRFNLTSFLVAKGVLFNLI